MNPDSSQNMERAIGRLEGKLDLVVNSVTSLQTSFETLEKGRLSRLEVQFATMHTEVETKAKFSGMIWGIIVSLVASGISGIVVYFLTIHPHA